MHSSSDDISPLMLEYSQYIEKALSLPLPDEVVERVKIHIVDTFAAILAGSRLVPGRRAIAWAAAPGGGVA